MYGLNTAKQAWDSLTSKYASPSRSRISHLKRQLQGIQQGSQNCTTYLAQAKLFTDQLAAVGRPISGEDFIQYITNGLNVSFTAFVTSLSFAMRDNPLSFTDFQAELLNHELLLDQQQSRNISPESGSIAFYSNKNRQRKPFTPTTQSISVTGTSLTGRGTSSFPKVPSIPGSHGQENREKFQICKRYNHTALDCFKRMDFSFQGRHPPTELATMVVDTNDRLMNTQWFVDSGANAHITTDAANIDNPQPFNGNDGVTGVGRADGDGATPGTK